MIDFKPPSKAPAKRLAALPPVHRWVMCFGLFFFALWLGLYFVMSFMQDYAPIFRRSLAEPTGILFVLSLSFLGFGLFCELLLNTLVWRQLRRNETQRLSDLCGRTRFDRSRKKHKLVHLEEGSPLPTEPPRRFPLAALDTLPRRR